MDRLNAIISLNENKKSLILIYFIKTLEVSIRKNLDETLRITNNFAVHSIRILYFIQRG